MSSSIFGEKMREQVEERLDCCEKDVAARKYLDVTKAAIECMTNTVSEEGKGTSLYTLVSQSLNFQVFLYMCKFTRCPEQFFCR